MATYTVVGSGPEYNQAGYQPGYAHQQQTNVVHVHHGGLGPVVNRGCARTLFVLSDYHFSVRAVICFWIAVSLLLGTQQSELLSF